MLETNWGIKQINDVKWRLKLIIEIFTIHSHYRYKYQFAVVIIIDFDLFDAFIYSICDVN